LLLLCAFPRIIPAPSFIFLLQFINVITDLSFYWLAVPVVILVGMSKGGFGGGLGTLAVPLLALMIDPRLAAAILLPILCGMDAVSLWSFRGTWDKLNLKILMPGAILGTIAGALTFNMTNADMVRLIVGVLSLYFVAHYLWGKHYLESLQQQKASPVRGSFWGAVAGYVSYIAHAGGPPVAIYLLPQHLPKTTLVGTTILFFSIINFIKLIPYVWLGQINSESFFTSLVLLPLAPLGVQLGIYLHNRVSDEVFYWVSYGFLLLAGLKLTYEGIAALW
jgi:uncharacterized protein